MNNKKILQVELEEYHPSSGNAFSRGLGLRLLRLMGWQVTGTFPKEKKMVVCLAPHTSNWDFFIAISAMMAMGLKASWIGKHSIFIWPIKSLLYKLGGIPVNRKHPRGLIDQVVDAFENRDSMVLGLAPEGTRKPVKVWKNGFLRMAKQANVPVCLAYFDGTNKQMCFDKLVWIDDLEQDMQTIREFYSKIDGVKPENFVK